MKEHHGTAAWQLTPCTRCRHFHPRHCPTCPNDPPCADHICTWPDDEEAPPNE